MSVKIRFTVFNDNFTTFVTEKTLVAYALT
jgi:hypothetical protein